jgi:hypothetical protein
MSKRNEETLGKIKEFLSKPLEHLIPFVARSRKAMHRIDLA